MKFDEQLQASKAEPPRPAQKTIQVPPEVWSPMWHRRPTSTVDVGLRLVSDAVLTAATEDAETMAGAKFPRLSVDWTLLYNDTLMRGVIVDALCEPNDISKQWQYWVEDSANMHLALDVLKLAVHRDGLKWFWREYEKLRVEIGLLAKPASNDDMQGLLEAMCPSSPFMRGMTPRERGIVRSHLGYNVDATNVLRFMTEQERAMFRRYMGVAVDLFMNAYARGTTFPIEEEPRATPEEPDEESIAVIENTLREAFFRHELEHDEAAE